MMAMMKAVAQQQGGGFSPLEVSWAHAYWPGGPAFKAEGHPNGQVMNDGETIPDEAGTRDLTSDSGAAETTLTYVASSNVNSTPGIRGADTSGNHPPFRNATLFSPRFGAQPGNEFYASATGWSVVLIWNQGPLTNAGTFGTVMHDTGAASWFEVMARNDNSLYIRISSYTYAPANSWTSGDTMAVVAKVQSNLHYLDVNGTNIANIARTGFSLTNFNLFMRNTSNFPFSGDLAFVGLYDGDCTSDPAWSDFETWAYDELGATV